MRGVFTIDPECPFLPSLARGLVESLGDRLASAVVLLPSRRACMALRDAFLANGDGAAMLLPRMQPVGEAGGEEPLVAGEGWIAPAIDPLRRKLLLARLVRRQRAAQGGVTDEHAIRLAGDLADFLDEMHTEEGAARRGWRRSWGGNMPGTGKRSSCSCAFSANSGPMSLPT
ncbi:MAG: hypothetical protein KDF64_09990, partial [Geminicoccaceae bacterium]|nr:hypothetical protein [Geminicoccaceae bacterium]